MRARLLDIDFAIPYDSCGVALNYQHSADLFNQVIGIKATIQVWTIDGLHNDAFEITADFDECRRLAYRLLDKIGEPHPNTVKH